MSFIWLLKSKDVQMLAMASNYHHAREQFKSMLKAHLDREPYTLFDEIVEIVKINKDNSMDEKNSYIKFLIRAGGLASLFKAWKLVMTPRLHRGGRQFNSAPAHYF